METAANTRYFICFLPLLADLAKSLSLLENIWISHHPTLAYFIAKTLLNTRVTKHWFALTRPSLSVCHHNALIFGEILLPPAKQLLHASILSREKRTF